MQPTRYERKKATLFSEVNCLSPPAALFPDILLMVFLTTTFVTC